MVSVRGVRWHDNSYVRRNCIQIVVAGPWNSLPRELVDALPTYLNDPHDYPFLFSACLVCKRWSRLIRPLLFRECVIQHSQAATALHNVLRSPASTAKFPSLIEILTFDARALQQPYAPGTAHLRCILSVVRGLRELRLAGITLNADLQSPLRNLHKLTHLSIADARFSSFSALFQLLNAAPALQVICLCDVSWRQPFHLDRGLPMAASRAPSCRSLRRLTASNMADYMPLALFVVAAFLAAHQGSHSLQCTHLQAFMKLFHTLFSLPLDNYWGGELELGLVVCHIDDVDGEYLRHHRPICTSLIIAYAERHLLTIRSTLHETHPGFHRDVSRVGLLLPRPCAVQEGLVTPVLFAGPDSCHSFRPLDTVYVRTFAGGDHETYYVGGERPEICDDQVRPPFYHQRPADDLRAYMRDLMQDIEVASPLCLAFQGMHEDGTDPIRQQLDLIPDGRVIWET